MLEARSRSPDDTRPLREREPGRAVFPDALTEFAFAFADQDESEYRKFAEAIQSRRIGDKEG
jgi:hypothetical protein